MTMKEIFKKVETYNEIAEMMRTDKASIYFADTTLVCSFGDHFKSYSAFTKYIRHEYFKEVADKILKGNEWEIDSDTIITMDDGRTITFTAELSAN